MKTLITDIKRFAIHDGDGVRTTVFFKGCSLKCIWCHNPETIKFDKQIAFFEHKCISCGICSKICSNHQFKKGKHIINRNECIKCGKCANECPTKSLCIYGKEMDTNEICEILLKDKSFYDMDNGVITLSGGECLLQSEACLEILKEMKNYGINTAVDTCGYVSKKNIDDVLPYTDTFLYDLKAMDENLHIQLTGKSNKLILENLKYIDSCGKNTEIRIPFVPLHNDGEVIEAGKFLQGLKNVTKIRVLPYHNLAESKYLALNYEDTLPKKLPTEKEIENAKSTLRSYGLNVI